MTSSPYPQPNNHFRLNEEEVSRVDYYGLTQLNSLICISQSKMAVRRHRSHRAPSGQEEWQMARSWLSSLDVLPEFHRASYPHASVFDLAQALRDGVLLCQVANRLRPNSVPDINMRPQMSPVCNLWFFFDRLFLARLAIVKRRLNILELDLINVQMACCFVDAVEDPR